MEKNVVGKTTKIKYNENKFRYGFNWNSYHHRRAAPSVDLLEQLQCNFPRLLIFSQFLIIHIKLFSPYSSAFPVVFRKRILMLTAH